MQEAARSRYNDVLDFDSSSAILKIEWREEDLGFTAHVQPFLSPVCYSYNVTFLLFLPKVKSFTPRNLVMIVTKVPHVTSFLDQSR